MTLLEKLEGDCKKKEEELRKTQRELDAIKAQIHDVKNNDDRLKCGDVSIIVTDAGYEFKIEQFVLYKTVRPITMDGILELLVADINRVRESFKEVVGK